MKMGGVLQTAQHWHPLVADCRRFRHHRRTATFSKAGYISHSADTSVKVQIAEFSDLKVRHVRLPSWPALITKRVNPMASPTSVMTASLTS